jgi:hypothetical protein
LRSVIPEVLEVLVLEQWRGRHPHTAIIMYRNNQYLTASVDRFVAEGRVLYGSAADVKADLAFYILAYR